MSPSKSTDEPLRRRLSLPLLVLYGTGVTVGAGIYVLIGPVAGHAGAHAPLAFVLAAIVMGLTVGSYAELCTRYPVAAGEAAYVKAAFQRRSLSIVTGLLMIGSGVIAAATVALGAAGYIAQFVDLPQPVVIVTVVAVLAIVSAWGVLESVLLACVFTVIEIGGLIAIIVAAGQAKVPVMAALSMPPLDAAIWPGIALASLLAFFAFTGFEDLTNMVEEAKSPERTVPIAMAITLVLTTLLYVAIAAISVTALPIERLAASPAPLVLVYKEIAGVGPAAIGIIAIVSTLNTIIAQMTMATRVVYGLARQGDLPHLLGRVSRKTSTPIAATAAIAVGTMALAFAAPIEKLAEWTSISTLIVFALVNLALVKLRLHGAAARKPGIITVPLIVPVLGLVSCVAMIVGAML